jgi:hypothetical protein
MKEYKIEGRIKIFPQKGGWIYVCVPKKITIELSHLADRGLIPITAQVGGSIWDTSLLPMGDGTHFIALNAKVRKAEGVEVGKTIRVIFRLRGSSKI